jgi:hypothetical protein
VKAVRDFRRRDYGIRVTSGDHPNTLVVYFTWGLGLHEPNEA